MSLKHTMDWRMDELDTWQRMFDVFVTVFFFTLVITIDDVQYVLVCGVSYTDETK